MNPLSLAQAHTLLKQYDCATPASVSLDRSQVRAALLQLVAASDQQILGICADSVEQGMAALRAYAQALGYTRIPTPSVQEQAIAGPVYIKFNPNADVFYITPYPNDYRGVLVSCQSADVNEINDLYGHLPLDLFD
ncbi:DUF1824 family protein [Trichothermofontia sp.]